MRTTVDIPDDLMKKAKVKAIEEGISFKELFTRSLEKELTASEVKENEMPWKALKGSVDLKEYEPGDSAFDEDWMPESEFFGSVNEPDAKNEDK